jgi:hypothetical protein
MVAGFAMLCAEAKGMERDITVLVSAESGCNTSYGSLHTKKSCRSRNSLCMLSQKKDTLFYYNIVCNMARARVAEPGQRRKVEGLVSKEFLGSNPIPRIIRSLHYREFLAGLFCFDPMTADSPVPDLMG